MTIQKIANKHGLMSFNGRFKSKGTDFVIHISRYVNPIFMFFMDLIFSNGGLPKWYQFNITFK